MFLTASSVPWIVTSDVFALVSLFYMYLWHCHKHVYFRYSILVLNSVLLNFKPLLKIRAAVFNEFISSCIFQYMPNIKDPNRMSSPDSGRQINYFGIVPQIAQSSLPCSFFGFPLNKKHSKHFFQFTGNLHAGFAPLLDTIFTVPIINPIHSGQFSGNGYESI